MLSTEKISTYFLDFSLKERLLPFKTFTWISFGSIVLSKKTLKWFVYGYMHIQFKHSFSFVPFVSSYIYLSNNRNMKSTEVLTYKPSYSCTFKTWVKQIFCIHLKAFEAASWKIQATMNTNSKQYYCKYNVVKCGVFNRMGVIKFIQKRWCLSRVAHLFNILCILILYWICCE